VLDLGGDARASVGRVGEHRLEPTDLVFEEAKLAVDALQPITEDPQALDRARGVVEGSP
jgi:hypothetical protein